MKTALNPGIWLVIFTMLGVSLFACGCVAEAPVAGPPGVAPPEDLKVVAMVVLQTRTPVPTNTASVTHTAAVAAKTTHTPNPTATALPPTATPAPPIANPTEAPLVIPGFNRTAVTGNLTKRGFTCTNEQSGPGGFTWTCTRTTGKVTYRTDVYGPTSVTVDLVNYVVFQTAVPDDGPSVAFLGFVAALPYDRADPTVAQQWVAQTLPTITGDGGVRTTVIGGVTFQLSGGPSVRSLAIFIE